MPEPDAREEGSAARSATPARTAPRVAGSRWWALRASLPSPRGGRSRACRRGLSASGCPPDAARPRAHTHTHTRAHAHAVRYFFGSTPASWEGPGSRNPSRWGGGGWRVSAGNAWVPAPGLRLCASSQPPFGARAWPLALPPGDPRGPALCGARQAGLGVGLGGLAGGAAGSGREAAVGSGAGESLDVGNSLPARPAERRGHAGAGRGTRLPAAGGSRAPHPPRAACRATPPARGLPSRPGKPPFGGDLGCPYARRPRALTSGKGPGLPQSCRLGTLRGAGAPARAGRASPSPGGHAPRSRRERAGARRGAAAACARVCVSERARESEGSERAGAICACLTRGCARDGSLPSSRSLWWRLGECSARRAGAPRRAEVAGGRRAGTPEAGEPRPPPPRSRPPPPPGAGLVPPRPRPRTPGGGALLLPTADAHGGSAQEGRRLLLAWQLSPETSSLRSDPSPLDFTASRVPRVFGTMKEPGFRGGGRRRGWGLGFSSGSPWLAAQKAPPATRPGTDPLASEIIAAC